jgi:hypothetical protein
MVVGQLLSRHDAGAQTRRIEEDAYRWGDGLRDSSDKLQRALLVNCHELGHAAADDREAPGGLEKREHFRTLQLEENGDRNVDVAAQSVALGKREI